MSLGIGRGFVAVLLCVWVAGCGATGPGSAVDEARAFAAEFDLTEAQPFPVADLPASANLTGIVGANLGADDATPVSEMLLGRASLRLGFDDGQVTGSATDFGIYEATQDADGAVEAGALKTALGGSLTTTGAVTGNTFTFNSQGRLTTPTGGGVGVVLQSDAGQVGVVAGQMIAAAPDVSGSLTPEAGSGLTATVLSEGLLATRPVR